jgi:hypothetical protein
LPNRLAELPMDNSTEIFRQPPRTRPGLRDLVGPILGLVGAAAFLAAIVAFLVWLSSV